MKANDFLMLTSDQIDFGALDIALLQELATQTDEPYIATSALGELALRDERAAAEAAARILSARSWDAHLTAYALGVLADRDPAAAVHHMALLLKLANEDPVREAMKDILLRCPEHFRDGEGATVRERLAPRARTTREMRFAASLDPCPGCRSHDVEHLELKGNDTTWWLSGACPVCGTTRKLKFESFRDPHSRPPTLFELGVGASELIAPERFLAEYVRTIGSVPTSPERVPPAEWRAGAAAVTRALTCINELLKMLPDAERVIPNTTDARLRRTWLEDEGQRVSRLLDAYAADKERNAAVERGGASADAVGSLDRAAVRAHQAWLQRGCTGDGRLVLEHVRAPDTIVGSAWLSRARFANCDLSNAILSFAALDGAELERNAFTGANLDGATLTSAILSGGDWQRARMAVTKLDQARVRGVDFTKSDLERSSWREAHVEDTAFGGVRFGNASFDGAVFERCNFSDASFARIQRLPEPSTRATRFVDCDLRGTNWSGRHLEGTTFLRCKLAGAHAEHASTDSIRVLDCDLSLDAFLESLHVRRVAAASSPSPVAILPDFSKLFAGTERLTVGTLVSTLSSKLDETDVAAFALGTIRLTCPGCFESVECKYAWDRFHEAKIASIEALREREVYEWTANVAAPPRELDDLLEKHLGAPRRADTHRVYAEKWVVESLEQENACKLHWFAERLPDWAQPAPDVALRSRVLLAIGADIAAARDWNALLKIAPHVPATAGMMFTKTRYNIALSFVPAIPALEIANAFGWQGTVWVSPSVNQVDWQIRLLSTDDYPTIGNFRIVAMSYRRPAGPEVGDEPQPPGGRRMLVNGDVVEGLTIAV